METKPINSDLLVYKYHIGKTIIDGIEYRKCRCCRKVKELNETNFLKRNTENGWRGACRICYNKTVRDKQESTQAERIICKKYRDKYKKEKPLEMLYKQCKGNSKKYNNREFTIEIQDLKDLWEFQKGKCYYTNREMKYELGFNNSVSIDRINSSKGYVKDNIVLCQRKINIMKNDASIEELISFCEDILKNKENFT